MIFQTLPIYVFPRDKCVCIRIVLPQNLPFLSMKRFVKASNMPLNFKEESATLKWRYKLFKSSSTIVCNPLFSAGGGGVGVEPPTIFSKSKGSVDRISIFRGGLLGKRGVIFFTGLQFIHKKQTKI